MTSRAREVKEQLAALRAQRDELEQLLETTSTSESRALRLRLAELGEDMVDLARELRRLMPEHRISCRSKWDYINGKRWEALEDKTWAEIERMEPDDRPATEQEMMRAALRKARSCSSMTEKQREYVDQILDQGKRRVDVARDCGVDKSTVSRTVKRGRAHLDRDIKAVYAILRNQGDGTGDLTVIDLSVPEVMEGVLNLLTKRQRTYLYLYYGEWMSLREIQALLGKESHSSILRSIRTALERIEVLALGGQVELRGWDTLEDRLMEHYNALDLESLKDLDRPAHGPSKDPPHGFRARLRGILPSLGLSKPVWIMRGAERRSAALAGDLHASEAEHWGSGRLLAALRALAARLGDGAGTGGRKAEREKTRRRIVRVLRNLMYKLFDLIRGVTHADNH